MAAKMTENDDIEITELPPYLFEYWTNLDAWAYGGLVCAVHKIDILGKELETPASMDAMMCYAVRAYLNCEPPGSIKLLLPITPWPTVRKYMHTECSYPQPCVSCDSVRRGARIEHDGERRAYEYAYPWYRLVRALTHGYVMSTHHREYNVPIMRSFETFPDFLGAQAYSDVCAVTMELMASVRFEIECDEGPSYVKFDMPAHYVARLLCRRGDGE